MMKVYYKIILYGYDSKNILSFLNHKKGDLHDYHFLSADYCCRKMEEAFENGFIGFGDCNGGYNRVANINIYHCSPYAEGACWDEMSIDYCPFCKEKILLIKKEKVYLIQKKKRVKEIITEEIEVKEL